MIIKSHTRNGYQSIAKYLDDLGENETTRIVRISDPCAMTMDGAFDNMWAIGNMSKALKPLHHISINPYQDERLTDKEVIQVIKRCAHKYGYEPGHHQYVVVEHVKKGRQHFHVVWNRISLMTGCAVNPGQHYIKSKKAAREMEKELGLKRVVSRRIKRAMALAERTGRKVKRLGRYLALIPSADIQSRHNSLIVAAVPHEQNQEILPKTPAWNSLDALTWAWEYGREDILAEYGIPMDIGP